MTRVAAGAPGFLRLSSKCCFKGANQPPHKRSKGHFFSRTLYWNKQPGEDPQSKSRNVKGINRMGGHPMEEYYDCW